MSRAAIVGPSDYGSFRRGNYGAALPAGAYRGALGRYRRGPSRQGAAIRGADMQRAVTLGGLSALGGADLCTDTGWVVGREILGSAFSLIGSAYAAPTKTEGSTSTSGGSPGYYAASTGGAVTDAWAAGCAAEAASAATVASQANTDRFLAEMQAQARAQQAAIDANQRTTEQQLSAMLAAQNKTGIDTNTLLIGGAIAGAALLAVLLLR